jgi:hypothetical protein
MKKLTLKIAELAVESFSIAERNERGGTVRAHVPETIYEPECKTQPVTGPCECIFTEGADRC